MGGATQQTNRNQVTDKTTLLNLNKHRIVFLEMWPGEYRTCGDVSDPDLCTWCTFVGTFKCQSAVKHIFAMVGL